MAPAFLLTRLQANYKKTVTRKAAKIVFRSARVEVGYKIPLGAIFWVNFAAIAQA